jgi:membrane protein
MIVGPRDADGDRHALVSTAAGLRGLVQDVRGRVRGHDLPLCAAGVTFYATLGLVPLVLLALFLSGQVAGEGMVRRLAGGVTRLLPDEQGARSAARFLSVSGTSMGWLAAATALLPASLYGEGLVRAFGRFSDGARRARSLHGRIGSLVMVSMSPGLLLAGLGASRALSSALGDGLGSRLLGVYFAFLVGWLTITPVLVFAYRTLSPERPCTRALLWGGAGTGSFLSGTCLGFVLFLSLGLDFGGAYGGSLGLATAAAAIGWIFVLHVIVLVGFVTTLALDDRGGHPLGAPA